MHSRPTSIRYRILTWLTLAAALSYLCRNAVGVAESTIREDLKLSLEQSGWFMGAFFWTYALFQVPTGMLAERYGTRLTLFLFACGWSVATLGIGIAQGFWMLITAQLLMGVAQAGIFPASTNSVRDWIPISQRSLACGILAAGMQVGAIVASGLTGELIDPLGWRWVFAVYAVPGVTWAIGFYLRYRNKPSAVAAVNESELQLIRSGASDVKPVIEQDIDQSSVLSGSFLFNPVMWSLCGQQVCRAAGYMFFASWFPTFLQETRGVSVSESGYQQGLVLAGTLIGSVVGGYLTDWIWQRTGSLRLSRSGVGAASLSLCSVLILWAWFVSSPTIAIVLLTLGSFFAALAGPCAFAATIDLGGSKVPQVFGLMNMSGNLAAAACPVLVGILFEKTEDWNLVLLLFAAVYLLGAISWLFVIPRSNHAQ